MKKMPTVLLAILAKQKEKVLPFYLECIDKLDYPKRAISVYVRTNNNTDRTQEILEEWAGRVGPKYERFILDRRNVKERVQDFGVHEWNEERFKVLGRIRQASLRKTLEWKCDYYFVVDVDNFLGHRTLRNMVEARLPIIAPMLRADTGTLYSNYHFHADENGYFRDTPQYHEVYHRRVKGLIQVDVVHCTYLVRADVIDKLTYDDGSGRYEYVIFSDSARRAGVPQYLDNREDYGYLTFDESSVRAESLMR